MRDCAGLQRPLSVAVRHGISVGIVNDDLAIMADSESLETVTEHERILQEIESTDTACVGPTLR